MNVIRNLLDSKKFVTALLGVVLGIAVELGIPEVQVEEIMAILSPLLVYIGAQGFTDRGKSAALVEQEGPR
tara:strand:- start:10779 stop:10991 length:213 start_codon:yes stop_codon:yes gene_type:complete